MAESVHPVPMDAAVARIVAQLDANRREAFEERAGIVEFDAGLTRGESERLALLDILGRFGLPGATCPRVLRAEIDGATHWVVTTDVAFARERLNDLGALALQEESLQDVLRSQYGDLAFLSTDF